MAFFFGFVNFSLNLQYFTINEKKNSIKREDIKNGLKQEYRTNKKK